MAGSERHGRRSPRCHAHCCFSACVLLVLLGVLPERRPLLGGSGGCDASASQLSSARSTAAAAWPRASACQRWLSSAGPGCTTSSTVAARLSSALRACYWEGWSHADSDTVAAAAAATAGRLTVPAAAAMHCKLLTVLTWAPCMPDEAEWQEKLWQSRGRVSHRTALPSSRSRPSGAIRKIG